MPDLIALIEEIFRQQLQDEARLDDLEIQATNIRASIAASKEEIAQLLSALEIAIKRGMAQPTDLEAIQARFTRGSQEHLPIESTHEPEPPDDSLASEEQHVGGEDEGDEEEATEEEGEGAPMLAPAPRSTKLIDLAYDVIQGFAIEREFTTADIRKEIAQRYPEKFAKINPASISGTVARLFTDYDAVIRVGEYTDGIHYRRKVKTEATKDGETSMIATTNPS